MPKCNRTYYNGKWYKTKEQALAQASKDFFISEQAIRWRMRKYSITIDQAVKSKFVGSYMKPTIYNSKQYCSLSSALKVAAKESGLSIHSLRYWVEHKRLTIDEAINKASPSTTDEARSLCPVITRAWV
jgi:hypothetical protein